MDIAQRLAAKLEPSGDCLVFTGTRSRDGYGSIRVGSQMVKTHRLAWELIVGPIPKDLCVLHRCDNPPCCYVDHLFLGTAGDNNADRAAKGRSRGTFGSDINHPATIRRGERHWRSKLSAANVAELRNRYSNGETQTALAKEFHVHSATVSRIVRRLWRQEVT